MTILVEIREICNVKPQDIVTIRSNELLAQLGIKDLDLILKERMLRWYRYVDCSKGAVKAACDTYMQYLTVWDISQNFSSSGTHFP